MLRFDLEGQFPSLADKIKQARIRRTTIKEWLKQKQARYAIDLYIGQEDVSTYVGTAWMHTPIIYVEGKEERK